MWISYKEKIAVLIKFTKTKYIQKNYAIYTTENLLVVGSEIPKLMMSQKRYFFAHTFEVFDFSGNFFLKDDTKESSSKNVGSKFLHVVYRKIYWFCNYALPSFINIGCFLQKKLLISISRSFTLVQTKNFNGETPKNLILSAVFTSLISNRFPCTAIGFLFYLLLLPGLVTLRLESTFFVTNPGASRYLPIIFFLWKLFAQILLGFLESF